MKQLTNTEKQELETKIQEEQERQQHLRETNPDLPETFKTKSAKTEFIPSPLWKYSFLAIILFLLAFNVFLFIASLNSDIKNITILNLMIAMLLLFNHIAYNFAKTGWKSRVMKIGTWVWIVFVFVYIYVSGIMRFDF